MAPLSKLNNKAVVCALAKHMTVNNNSGFAIIFVTLHKALLVGA